MAVTVVLVGCYEPPQDRCAIRCTPTAADACPGSLVCNTQGYCVGSAGDVCTLELTTVRIGARHACGLDAGGRLYCWGDDESGQLGLGNGSDGVIAPSPVGDPSVAWSVLAAGGDHTCAIKNGEVYCWGQNNGGESRGNAGGIQTTPFKVAISPLTPVPPSGFSQLAAGGEHSCAIGDGQLWCWGDKEAIGADHSFMERVGTLSDWTEVSTGKTHTCGVSTSMGILCFGHNDHMQLGQTDGQDRAMPTAPANGQPTGRVPLHVLAGAGYTCALLGTAPTDTMGELWCWGENGNHEIDSSNTNPLPAATQIGTTADWTHVTGGARRVCAMRTGHAYCWGQTYAGGLGDGVFNEQIDATQASDLGSVDDIQLGVSTHTDQWDDLGCLTANGQIKCWGENAHGGVGAGTPANMSARGVEVHAPNAHPWTHVVAGHNHSCAVTDNNQMFCWGVDDVGESSGQPGRGDSNSPCIPTQPCDQPLPVISPVPHADHIAAGDYYSCALDGTSLTCWGYDDRGTLGASGNIVRPVAAPSGEQWTNLFGGDRGNCGTTDASKLYCWGILYNNQTVTLPTEQTDPDLQPSMLEVKIGDNFACGVRSDNTRICWGANNNYQLGINTNTDVADPSFMNMLSTVDHVVLRNDHMCAIGDADHHVACWGLASASETGASVNPATTPTAVTDARNQGLTMCSSVSTGDRMSCAVCMGQVQCWGGDGAGELGRGSVGMNNNNDLHAAPVVLPAGMMFTELASGNDHTCAITTDGRMYCWGYGLHGELGDGGHGLPIPTLLAPGR